MAESGLARRLRFSRPEGDDAPIVARSPVGGPDQALNNNTPASPTEVDDAGVLEVLT